MTEKFNSQVLTYQSRAEANEVYSQLSDKTKLEMASVYQEAFGGYPWYEKFTCVSCGNFLKDPYCLNCQLSQAREAYPTDELVNEYFRGMFEAFTPGMLGLISRLVENPTVAGFTTGGFVVLENLIVEKYRKNTARILDSILGLFQVDPNDLAFYDNETCILPAMQNQGIGRQLSETRIQTAKKMWAIFICGRTINKLWLSLKERQLTDAGYQFQAQVPDGDTYQVDGKPRYFYLAKAT